MGVPGGAAVKNLPASAGDAGSIPGLGRSPGEGNSNPLQYSCLGKPMDRGVWWATVNGWVLVTQSCPTLCNLMDCSMPGSSVHGISPSRNTGIGSHFLLQGILPTQRSNQGLPHCSQILYLLSYLREAHSWGHKRAGHDFSD